MRRTYLATFAAAALLGWGLPADVLAQTSSTTAGSTTEASKVSQSDLQSYVTARQAIEKQDPSLKTSLESADLEAQKDKIQTALKDGGGLSADEFIRIHRMVHSDPAMRAQVESQMGGSTSGAGSSTTGSTGAAPASSPK